ncbi:MAG: hypothetical protein ABI467_06405 [Kofleriaceae bacterium]
MKLSWVLVFGLSACGAAAQPSVPVPVIVANACPALELSCKDTVEKAGVATKLDPGEITVSIGKCEQQGWSVDARKCVAAAHANAELVTCGSTFKLGPDGIFADRTSTDKAMSAMTKFRDEMCACTDSACAQRVSDEMTKWGQEEARNDQNPPKMTEDDVKRFTRLGEIMGTCMQKAMGGGTTP